jgi:hypothetical protein
LWSSKRKKKERKFFFKHLYNGDFLPVSARSILSRKGSEVLQVTSTSIQPFRKQSAPSYGSASEVALTRKAESVRRAALPRPPTPSEVAV